MSEPLQARYWLCAGQVQGVGFRPFVYRIARRHRLQGWVRNLAGQVEILGQGRAHDLDGFAQALVRDAPPAADPRIVAQELRATTALDGFAILASSAHSPAHVHIPPDRYLCDDCLAELVDPHQRRYRYPFINCTQCGPRYTLIRALPYDRPSTTMSGFPLCPACAAEYTDPGDHRFHAEPIACPDCGPRLRYREAGDNGACEGEAALQACIDRLRRGGIVALKGVGGYQLLCDAAAEASVALLRRRKRRPSKPLAVMFPDDDGLATLRRFANVTAQEQALLRAPTRPIVLVSRRVGTSLGAGIAPGRDDIGAMLPSSPLHRLLLAGYGGPLVATSGNLGGEPMLTEDAEAVRRLAGIADAFLSHDRPIARPADDPVCRMIAGRPRWLRLGRGVAPLELTLPRPLPEPVLALGGHLKNTVALGWGSRVVISQHLGDMHAPRSLALLREVAADLQRLYGVTASRLLCDAHPDYATTRLATHWGLPVTRVLHHHAHASALAGERPADGGLPWLVFAWDGAGLGDDGTLWGGEALFGTPGHWRRAATFRGFALPGGERAAREPWRSALGLAWEAGSPWQPGEPPENLELLRSAWRDGSYFPRTTSVGRLFDAAAALTGLCSHCSYEGQAAMALESACHGGGTPAAVALPLRRRQDGVWVSDWEPLLAPLCDDRRSLAERAMLFHGSLAQNLIAQARAVRDSFGQVRLGGVGGVFQNRRLAEYVAQLALAEGFEFVLPERLPANDAGLSFGQLIEHAAQP